MAKSTALANSFLDSLYGDNTPPAIYVELYTAAPNPDGTGGTIVAGGGYAAQVVTNDDTNFPPAAAREKSNALAVTFPAASANWGTVVAVALKSASGAGNVLHFGNLETPRTVQTGDVFSFAPTQLVIREN